MQMTKFEISKFYRNLENGDKGLFIAYISLTLGSSPITWQRKILNWISDDTPLRLSPVIQKRLFSIIENEEWREVHT